MVQQHLKLSSLFLVLKSGNIPNVDVFCQLCATFARQVRQVNGPMLGVGR